MGLEAACDASLGRKRDTGKARLEATELIFRGATLRFEVPLKEATAVTAKAGVLSLASPAGRVRLFLGTQAAAEKWALKIRTPRSLMDKLGVTPESLVSVLGDVGAAFDAELAARGCRVTRGRAARDSDVVIVVMKAVAALPKLEALRGAIRPNGAIWVVWPKGRREFREDDVRAYGPRAGLVDVKVASVSETLSGLKMVIPVSQRRA